MKEKYYNIHNIVKFKIAAPTSILKFKFDNIYGCYENFESPENHDLDFMIILGDFNPSNQNCSILEDKYYISQDYIYCKRDSYKFTKWEFEISGLETKCTIVHISSNFWGYMWMSGFIIEFLIHFKMNQKGYPIIHASCVSLEDKGFLFSTRGGGGKTTIAMHLLEKGFKLLGDNFIIIGEDNALCYLSPLNIFTYNLTPIVKKSLGFNNKVVLSLKNVFYNMTGGYIKIFTKMNPKKAFPHQVDESTNVSALFFITPRESLRIEKIDKIELCNFLVTNQQLDTLFFLEYISNYSYIYPNSKLSQHWLIYKKNLIKNLPNRQIYYKIEVPQKYDSLVLEEIVNFILNNLSINEDVHRKGGLNSDERNIKL